MNIVEVGVLKGTEDNQTSTPFIKLGKLKPRTKATGAVFNLRFIKIHLHVFRSQMADYTVKIYITGQ